MATNEVTSVKVSIDGFSDPITLTKDGTSGTWTASVQAPNWSTYNCGALNYTVNATANTSAEATPVTGTISIVEKNAPIITLTSLTEGSTTTSNTPPLKFTVTDNNGEANDWKGNVGCSGVNKSSFQAYATDSENNKVTFNTSTIKNIDGGYSLEYGFTDGHSLSDGQWELTVTAKDNDGNVATVHSNFEVRTAIPEIAITSPTSGLMTNKSPITVSGTCKSQGGSITYAYASINDGAETAITVAEDGLSFTGSVALSEGDNTIKIRVVDSDGLETSQTVTVYYSASIPVISNVVFTPNPLEANGGYTITCTVTI